MELAVSVNDLIAAMAHHPEYIALYLGLLPLLGFLASYNIKFGLATAPIKIILSCIIYLAALPGMLASALVFYSLLILHQNILNVNALIYFAPIISMIATFTLIKRKIAFNRLPGFDRLSGLMMLLFITCLIVLLLYRFRLVVGFFGSLSHLLIAGVVIFIAFKIALHKLFSKRN